MATNKKRLKTLNLTLAPRLRAYLEAFVEMNDRKSATQVIEESLRAFFKQRGIDVEADPELILNRIIAERQEREKSAAKPPSAAKPIPKGTRGKSA